jgi:hypothetical protein
MVEECVHVNEKGHKCRRIPKRGQKLCPAHRTRRRGRAVLGEDPAFFQEMDAFMNRLKAMNLEDLLYATNGALGDIHGLIDRRSSRRDRAAFMRATVAVGEAMDRIFLTIAGYRAEQAQRSGTTRPVSPETTTSRIAPSGTTKSATINPATFPAPLAKLFALPPSAQPSARPQLSPEELQAACAQLLSILDPNGTTTSILNSNT